MSAWTELANSLYDLYHDLIVSGFTPEQALSLTSDMAKTMAIENLRAGSQGMK